MYDPIARQSAVILRAMGMDGEDVSHASRMRTVAAVVEEITRAMWVAVRDGRLSVEHIAQFRDGLYPSDAQLHRRVLEISKRADDAVKEAA